MSDPSARGAPVYRLERQAFDPLYLREVEHALTRCEYVGASPLGAEFVLTQGFSLVFKRSSLGDVTDAFPFLRPFLEAAVFPASNAFFLNPLIMGHSSEVRPHIDCRLIAEQDLRIIPNLVSILYVRSEPEMSGGEITLGSGRPDAVSIKPSTNNLLHFKGDIVHHVTAVESDHKRVCLVCEQYRLPDHVLAGFPELDVITDAGQFGDRTDALGGPLEAVA